MKPIDTPPIAARSEPSPERPALETPRPSEHKAGLGALEQLVVGRELQPGAESQGVLIARAFAGSPDAEGVLARYPLCLPPFTDAVYYACSQAHDPLGQTNTYWPGGANRMQALHVRRLDDLTHGGALLLLQLAPDHHLALLPLVGDRTAAYFASSDGGLVLELANFGVGGIEGDLPLCAWGRGDSPLAATREAWRAALAHPLIAGSTQPRAAKRYPEPLTYLGWCTWEQYKFDIDEPLLHRALDAIDASGLPIRYVLVDDGHLDHRDRALRSFDPDADKFPRGWDGLLARRRDDGVRWFGLWLCFNGYWRNIAADNALGELNEHLSPVPSGGLKPAEGFLHAFAFYDAMVGAARDAGFDFVKVDDQAQGLMHYRGVAQPVQQAAENSQALETACARHVDGLINCMAHNAVCLFNTRLSAVTRCSEDYKVNDAWRAKAHLHNSFANMLWFGPTVWGDHDMFHSNDPLAGRPMAISKAMSGGPIYLSDEPTAFGPANIWPLCFRDGRLLRPLAPAVPLPDSVYFNPFTERRAYRTVAPLANGAAAVALFNLTHPGATVQTTVTPADHRHAAEMLDDPASWAPADEGLVLYDWQTEVATRFNEEHRLSLDELGCALYLLLPIRHGWAAIGRPDKFLSPAAIEVLFADDDELILRTLEAGPVLIWSEHPPHEARGMELQPASENCWRLSCPPPLVGQPIRLQR